MDFITGLPKNGKQNDSIMVVVDKLRKATHFIPVKSTYKAINIADSFMKEIYRLHGVRKVVISNRDAKFTRIFWKALFKGLYTKLNFSIAYHSQNVGQIERVNQNFEMLRMDVMDEPDKWEDYLHLVEFAYNNNFQASNKLSPFEILYGRKCSSPISWSSPVNRLMLGPHVLKDMELK